MQSISASAAKQNFGTLLSQAAVAPVSIERHGKAEAIMCSPSLFARLDPLADRRRARLEQSLVEKDRLIRHQRIAVRLLAGPAAAAQKMIADAKAVVSRWKREKLCSDDYINRWSRLLVLPKAELALALMDENDDWGLALRQNSPWNDVL